MHSAGLNADAWTVVDSLSSGIVTTDEKWAILYTNAAAEQILGLSRAQLSKRDAREIIPVFKEFERDGRWICAEVVTLEHGSHLIQLQDVTARRQADLALEANKRFLQAVLDNIDAGIVACDAAGKLTLSNNAARVFHGITQESLSPGEWPETYELYGPDGTTPLPRQDTPLNRAFSGIEVRRQEIVIAPRQGRRRSVLCSGHALTGRDGRKLGAVVALHDITHRKISGARVRHSLRQFRDLFNRAPIAYHEIDCEGRIRRVNVAELRLLERTRDEMLGRPVWEFVSEEERGSSREAVIRKLTGRCPLKPFVREYVTPSGKRLVLECHETLIQDPSGAITGIRTALMDVTTRIYHEQQAQALIREKAAREQAEMDSAEIRSILERIGDAYMAFDTGWRYTYVNRRAAELALKPASELIGKCVWDEFPEAVHTAFYTELHRAMREQVPVEFDNYFAPLGKWFQNSVYPSPSGVGVFYRDTTERVRTEIALKRRTAELARKNTELETFASVVSHDLQEPLRMIGGYAGLLAKRYRTSLDGEAGEFLSYISNGVTRMQRLIKDLLALSRLDRVDDTVDEVKVSNIVELVCGNLDLVIEDSHANVTKRDLPVVRFNETQLLQVMQNLIGNALKYRSEAHPQITVTGQRYENGWVISVADNGIGFEMEFAEQVFRPFRRLHRREDGGTGIGLAICRKIVQARGGRIWVESQPGIGSTFYFTIPDAIPVSE